MDKINNIKTLLNNISLSEGATFEYDENRILDEYQKLSENKSSLAIKILSIFGGIIATIIFLVFLFFTGLYSSEIGVSIFGGVFILFAIFLNKEYDKTIIATISVCTYITGFLLLTFGLVEMETNNIVIFLIINSITMCSLFITQNYILSFISILIISASSIFMIITNGVYNLIHLYITICISMLTYLMLNESKLITSHIKISKLYNPSRIGLIISVFFGLITIGKRHLIPVSKNHIWLSSIVISLITIYLVYLISKINKIDTLKSKILIYTLSASILIPTILSPSISGAIVIILLSFLINYKTGLAIGIISFIYFISQYYYDLNLTLLTKSIILLSSGILFLLFYLFTIKTSTHNEKI